jgi:SAM-dependent methyltransferase
LNKGNAWSRSLPRGGRGSLLDIGCGSGAFLLHLRKLNPDLRLVGCDPFGPEDCGTLARSRIEYYRKDVFDCGFRAGEFTIVTINHVLEHHPNPAQLLDYLFQALQPGGRLCIGVPNTNGAGRRIFGSHWVGWRVPRHLVHFSDSGLARLLDRRGFRDIRVRHIGNVHHHLESMTYVQFGKKRPPLWWRNRLTQESVAAFLNPVTKLANLLSLGDNIEVTCVRP